MSDDKQSFDKDSFDTCNSIADYTTFFSNLNTPDLENFIVALQIFENYIDLSEADSNKLEIALTELDSRP